MSQIINSNNVYCLQIGLITRPLLYSITGILLIFCSAGCSDPASKDPDRWLAPTSESEKKIPFSDLRTAAEKGKELYHVYCWTCHGETGLGDGAAGNALNRQPTNFHSNRTKDQTDGALFWKMSSGNGEMPGFSEALTDVQRWQLTAYIRRLSEEAIPLSPPKIIRGNFKIELFMETGPEAVRIVYHRQAGQLFYTSFNGDVFRIIQRVDSAPYTVKILSVKDHGINRLQGAALSGNYLFLAGNVDLENKKGTRGRMVKYLLTGLDTMSKTDSLKIKVVFTTSMYGSNKTIYDHGWNALELSQDEKFIYVNSGARTDHGEVQDNGGAYPNARENALTAKIFRFPADAENLFLEDNEAKLDSAGFIFARGIRNAYDMAFDKSGHLFAVVNSSDYDNPEDMFWVRQGHHYGFPWVMGGIENPQQYPGWIPDPETNPFISRTAHSWQVKYFKNDSSFPKMPDSLRISSGVQNLGPDANEYRGHSGRVLDGDRTGVPVSTFTPHCSPLGLFFDKENRLPGEFRGSGFVIRYNNGARSGMMRPFTREGADMLHLTLEKDTITDNYFVKTKRIVEGFHEPADAVLVGNVVYVIEYGGQKGNIWKISFMP